MYACMHAYAASGMMYTSVEVIEATCNFDDDNLIGKGGFGEVR
jgi:hypothetical protein